jgi:hypothetical protein
VSLYSRAINTFLFWTTEKPAGSPVIVLVSFTIRPSSEHPFTSVTLGTLADPGVNLRTLHRPGMTALGGRQVHRDAGSRQ